MEWFHCGGGEEDAQLTLTLNVRVPDKRFLLF